MKRLLVVVTLAAVSLGVPAFAAVPATDELVALIPPDSGAGVTFGVSAAVDRETGRFVIGAPAHGPSSAGAAYVVERDGDGWTYTILQSSPPDDYSDAGSAVAIEGDLIAVGAPRDSTVKWNGGAVYLFRRIGEKWVPAEILQPDIEQNSEYFGSSVDISRGRIAVGAPEAPLLSDQWDRQGAVFVYEIVDGEWTYTRLAPDDGYKTDFFGTAVKFVGDTLFVGSPGNDANEGNSGAVYVYQQVSGQWAYREKIYPLDPVRDLSWGAAIDADGDRVAVTATARWGRNASQGRVHVLTKTGSHWEQEIAYPGDPLNPNMGVSVALDGSTIYVSGFGSGDWKLRPGIVIVVEETADGWVEVGRIKGPGTAAAKQLGFGWALAAADGAVVVGAPLYHPTGSWSGEGFTAGGPPMSCLGRPATILGTPGDDVLAGTGRPDVIVAGSGDDRITGVASDDLVCSGPGTDTIDGPATVADLSRWDTVLNDGGRIPAWTRPI